MSKVKIPNYSLSEEIINAITHGIGAGLSIAGLIILIVISVHHDSLISLLSCLSYGIILILMYTISCIYHSLSPKLMAKKVLRIIDHCNVYLLVAGTYTPVSLVCIGGMLGWLIFSIVWIITIIGIILTCINIDKYQMASVACHLIAGWAALLAIKALFTNMELGGIILLITGGLAYSLGSVLYVIGSKKKYMHSIFHLFVLLGSILHYFMICLYII